MIGRAAERFCKGGVCLSRDEDEDENEKLESLEKGGGGRIKGGKGEGEREGGAWCLVTYLTCTSLPLIPYEMRYMSTYDNEYEYEYLPYENFSLASSTVQVQSAWLFLLLYDR